MPLRVPRHEDVTPRGVKVGHEVMTTGERAGALYQQHGVRGEDVKVADGTLTRDGHDAVVLTREVAPVVGNVVRFEQHVSNAICQCG